MYNVYMYIIWYFFLFSVSERSRLTPQFKTPPLKGLHGLQTEPSQLTSQFKTPPLKGLRGLQRTSPSLSLNKDPSPATIHSLLHDKFSGKECTGLLEFRHNIYTVYCIIIIIPLTT